MVLVDALDGVTDRHRLQKVTRGGYRLPMDSIARKNLVSS